MLSCMNSTETYYWYKKNRVCVRCHNKAASKDSVMCLDCKDKQAIATMKYRSKLSEFQKVEQSEKNRYYMKIRYARAKESGICVRCFKNKARPGKTTCQYCFNKIKTYQKIYSKERRDQLKSKEMIE